jgi:hypothetical protein
MRCLISACVGIWDKPASAGHVSGPDVQECGALIFEAGGQSSLQEQHLMPGGSWEQLGQAVQGAVHLGVPADKNGACSGQPWAVIMCRMLVTQRMPVDYRSIMLLGSNIVQPHPAVLHLHAEWLAALPQVVSCSGC